MLDHNTLLEAVEVHAGVTGIAEKINQRKDKNTPPRQ